MNCSMPSRSFSWLNEPSYAVSRINAEREIHPVGSVRIPRFRYEFWTAETIDENLFRVLTLQIAHQDALHHSTVLAPCHWFDRRHGVLSSASRPRLVLVVAG